VSDAPRIPEADLAAVRTVPIAGRANKVDPEQLIPLIVWGVDAALGRA